MAAAGYDATILQRAVELVEEELRSGARPPDQHVPGARSAVQTAAQRAIEEGLTKSRQVFRHILDVAKNREGLEPDWTAYRPRVYQHRSPGAPVLPSQDHIADDDPEGDPIECGIIGDAHDSPHLRDKSRFRWLGCYIAERGLERAISVGDWWTMDCFSTHHDRATFEGFAKPTFEQDLESFHESQQAFHSGLAGHKPKLDCTLGNHEHRAWKYDNLHPDGMSHSLKVQEAFAQWGWRTTVYGEYRFIAGVGFVHIPFNALGRPLTQSQRPNKAMFDTVHGDDHRATQLTDYKAGPVRSPTIYSAATALPPGFIEGYTNKGGSTWRSGICEGTIWGSFVRKWSFTEMILLRRRYGRSGEGAPKTISGWKKAS